MDASRLLADLFFPVNPRAEFPETAHQIIMRISGHIPVILLKERNQFAVLQNPCKPVISRDSDHSCRLPHLLPDCGDKGDGLRIGNQDTFGQSAPYERLLEMNGVTVENIVASVKAMLD